MVDIKAFPYLCFVRFDLTNKEFDRQFNIHFDEHIQELADRPGYSTAWRTQELRGSGNEGVMEQEYQQIYAINDPGLFKSFPHNPPSPVTESEPWRRDLGNWGRVFYRVLALLEKDPRAGRCWKDFVTDALREKLVVGTDRAHPIEPAWMKGFGKLRRLHKETVRVQSIIDREFEVIEPEDRR